MLKLSVVKWVDYYSDDPDIEDDVEERLSSYEEYRQALIAHLRKHKICFAGFDHQREGGFAPLFSDGTKLATGFRHWGDIMFEAWGERIDNPKKGVEYSYFAWNMPDGMKAKYPTASHQQIVGAANESGF